MGSHNNERAAVLGRQQPKKKVKVKSLGESFLGFGNRCLAAKDVADRPIPMPNCPPSSDRPQLIFASYPRSQLPYTELGLYLGNSSDHLVHSRALRGISLDHIGHQWFHEFESPVSLDLPVSMIWLVERNHADLDKFFPY